MAGNAEDTVFNAGRAEWLRSKGADSLDADQKALLLALAQLEAEVGRQLSADEQSAIASLADGLQGFDSKEILRAVRRMVNEPADPKRQMSWEELKRRHP